MASYAGLDNKELRTLLKQGLKSKIRCEFQHPNCGASTEGNQDGRAPCLTEILYEIQWRTVGTATVE